MVKNEALACSLDCQSEDVLQLGQNLIVGLPGPSLDKKTEIILRQIKPAGILLYSRNYKSVEQLKDLVENLQNIALKETGVQFFIMIDEEPQGANRLGVFSNVFTLGLPEWPKIEEHIKVLKNIGINVDLAPIADFPYDRNTFIKRRLPVEKEDDLVVFNRTFIDLLNRHGIAATMKHFPGLGIFQDDPHRSIPRSLLTDDVFRRSINIFYSGILDGAQFVMTGHAIYDNIDKENPATFSQTIIQNILKGQLQFRGLVITDDLSDMPLNNYKGPDRAEAVALSINAGHNLVILSHHLQRTQKIFKTLLARMSDDKAFRSNVVENSARVIEYKKALIAGKLASAQASGI